MSSSSKPVSIHPRPMPESEAMSIPSFSSKTLDVDVDEQDQLRKVYHYFLECSVMQLRKIARVWNCRQVGPKKTLVARLYLYILDRMNDTISLEQLIGSNEILSGFEQWCNSHKQRLLWPDLPNRDQLLKITSCGTEQPSIDIDNFDKSSVLALWDPMKELSASEFARLLLIIQSVDVIKQAIGESNQKGLTNAERIRRRQIWKTHVEILFNDDAVRPVLNLRLEDDVDSARLPSRFRSGDELMSSYNGTKYLYLQYLEMWQNDDDQRSFTYHLNNVLAKDSKLTLSAMKVRLMWYVFEGWLESSDAVTLGLSLKTAIRVNHLGTSVCSPSIDAGVNIDANTRTSRGRRNQKRKRDIEEGVNESTAKDALPSLKFIHGRSDEQVMIEREEHRRKIRLRHTEELAKLMKGMEDGRRIMKDYKDDEELREMAQILFERSKKEFIEIAQAKES